MHRRRFKQTTSLKDRLASFAEELKAKAFQLRPGPERDALLKRAHGPTCLTCALAFSMRCSCSGEQADAGVSGVHYR